MIVLYIHHFTHFRISLDCLKSPPCLRGPEKVIDFNGHVIGMAISPDGRYLYVNVRTWVRFPKNAISRHFGTMTVSYLEIWNNNFLFSAGQCSSDFRTGSSNIITDWASGCRPLDPDQDRKAVVRASGLHTLRESILFIRRCLRNLRWFRIWGRTRVFVGQTLWSTGKNCTSVSVTMLLSFIS